MLASVTGNCKLSPCHKQKAIVADTVPTVACIQRSSGYCIHSNPGVQLDAAPQQHVCICVCFAHMKSSQKMPEPVCVVPGVCWCKLPPCWGLWADSNINREPAFKEWCETFRTGCICSKTGYENLFTDDTEKLIQATLQDIRAWRLSGKQQLHVSSTQ